MNIGVIFMKGTIRKIGKKWGYQLFLGNDQETGKPIFKTKNTFSTKKEAELACSEAIAELAQGKSLNRSMTFGQFATYWLESKEGTVQDDTFAGYHARIKTYLIPYFKSVKLEDIDEIMIRKWLKHLNTKLKSTGHIADIFKFMRQMMQKAMKKRIINYNPFDDLETPKSERKKMEVWSSDDIHRFFDKAKESVYFIPIYLAVVTGMRQSEILGLKWDAINFDNNTISVLRTLSVKTRKLKESTKNESSKRSVAITNDIAEVLKKHRIKQNKQRLLLGSAWKEPDLVCTTEVGTVIRARNLLRALYHFQERAGVKKITFHEIRHSHATMLLEAGVETPIVSERLGHKSIDITIDIYSHVLPNMQQKAAEKISQIINIK